jgi:hypothetical protein
MTLWFVIAIMQIAFAFACVREAKRKGLLNNWIVLAAATFGIFAYLFIRWLPSKNIENHRK